MGAGGTSQESCATQGTGSWIIGLVARARHQDDIEAAAAAMGKIRRAAYRPNAASSRAYDALYAEYDTLHDYFGRGTNDVMHRLRAIRRGAGA